MVTTALAAAVALTFALSAATKLADPAAFRRSLPATLGVAPARARVLAPVVVAAESAVVLAVVAGIWAPPVALLGFAAATVLLGVFTAAVRSMIARKVTEPCHCFGPRDAPPGPVDLLRNGILLAIAVAGGLGVGLGATVGAADVVRSIAGALAGAGIALLVVHLDELRWLIGPAPASGGPDV
jgi:hypothetical protein